MAVSRILNLFALSSLAILVCSFGSTGVLASDGHRMMRARAHDHGVVAKHKRTTGSTQRCQPRPTTTSTSGASSVPASSVPVSSTPSSTPASVSSSKSSTVSSSPTSSSPPSQSSSPSSGNGGKVGLAWPNGNDPSLSDYVTSKTSSLYTWDVSCPSNAAQLGLDCWPMLWSDAPDRVSAFQQTVVKGYANTVMGFNECNEPGQANMSPADAASSWQKYIEPLWAQGYRTISPSTSSNPNGMDWTKQFFGNCTGCHVDALSVHYYDVTAQGFINYVTNFHNTFNMDVIPTEFACQSFVSTEAQCSESQVQDFYSTIIQWMDETEWIPTYFAFGIMQNMQGVNTLNQLMDPTTKKPTSLGTAYINENF